MKCTSLCNLAMCVVNHHPIIPIIPIIPLAQTDDNVLISGFVVSSRNPTTTYPRAAVVVYRSDSSNSKQAVAGMTNTNAWGRYEFKVPHSQHYLICALVNGLEACVHNRVLPPPQRAAGDFSVFNVESLNIPVPPADLGANTVEIQVIHTSRAGFCDWDSTVITPYQSTCMASARDPDRFVIRKTMCAKSFHFFFFFFLKKRGRSISPFKILTFLFSSARASAKMRPIKAAPFRFSLPLEAASVDSRSPC